MVTWPANSWLFWLLVAVAIGLFARFGLYPRRDEPRRVWRLAGLGTLALAAVLVTAFLPGMVLASLTGAGVAGDVVDLSLWCAAAVLGAVAILLMGWAMFSDRSRGRRRCPACWYDMSGARGLMCPECGKTVKSERGWHRTRRRWRVVPVVVVLLAVSAGNAVAPVARSNQWPQSLPDVALFAAMPFASGSGIVAAETRRRLYDPAYETRLRLNDEQSVTGWVAGWAIRKCLRETPAGLRVDNALEFLQHAQGIERFRDDIVLMAMNGHLGAASLLFYVSVKDPALKAVAEQLMVSADKRRVAFGAQMMAMNIGFGSNSTEVPAEVQALLDSGVTEQTTGVVLSLYREQPSPLIDGLIDGWLVDERFEVRCSAVQLLLYSRPDDPRLRRTMLAWLESGTAQERHAAAWHVVDYRDLEPEHDAMLAQVLVDLQPTDRDRLLSALLTHAGLDSGRFVRIAEACDTAAGARPGILAAVRQVAKPKASSIERFRALEAKWRREGDTISADGLDAVIDQWESIPQAEGGTGGME